jgi:hypothetical protein
MENKSATGPTVAKFVNRPFPKEYQGTPRLIVPCVRSTVSKGEVLSLKILTLQKSPVTSVSVMVRMLGHGDWQKISASHVAGGVWKANMPAAREDFEYYITGGESLKWPATAPGQNQTVVVQE